MKVLGYQFLRINSYNSLESLMKYNKPQISFSSFFWKPLLVGRALYSTVHASVCIIRTTKLLVLEKCMLSSWSIAYNELQGVNANFTQQNN